MKSAEVTTTLWKQKSYSWGVCIGILSGMLWGLNNFLFARGYDLLPLSVFSQKMDVFMAAVFLPVICAAVNDICAAAALLIFNGVRGVLTVVRHHLFTKAGFFVCLAALLGGPIGQSAYFLGITFAGSSTALIITAMYPIVGCILAHFFLHQKITVRMWIGIFISVTGAILVGYIPVEESHFNFSWGVMFAALAALCWGSEVVLSYYGMIDMEPDIAITLRECISGGILSIMVVLTGHFFMLEELLKNAITGVSLLSGAGIIAGFSYLLWYAANKKIGCARGMAANSTYVIWGVVCNTLYMGFQSMSMQILAGCLCVMLGIILVSLNNTEI